MNCAFCDDNESNENNKRIIIENTLAKACPTTQPIVPGHILIVPKRCISNFEDMTPDELNDVFNLMKKVKDALRKAFDCEGFNHAWNENKVAGQTVPHFHLHVVPRKQGDRGIYEYEPRKFLYRPGSRENSEDKELREISNLLIKNI